MESNTTGVESPFATPKASLQDSEMVEYDTGSVFSPRGRLGRIDYIIYSFGVTLVAALIGALLAGLTVATVSSMSSESPVSSMVAGLANLLISIPVLILSIVFAIRRFHDLNWRGWWSVLVFIPLANIIVAFILMCVRGTEGENNYGLPRPPPSTFKIVVALILPTVFVIGILAAIAIPAYQGYLAGAQVG